MLTTPALELRTEAGDVIAHAQDTTNAGFAFIFLHVCQQCVIMRTEDQLHSAIAVLTGIRAKLEARREAQQIVAQSNIDVDAIWANVRAGRPIESQMDGIANELAEAA
jgi:hypothetical protein